MIPKPSEERINYIRSLSSKEVLQIIIDAEFTIGEDEYLIETLRNKANVNCDDEDMWEILYYAMDHQTDPDTVLGRLAS
jgi:hypothetical protein